MAPHPEEILYVLMAGTRIRDANDNLVRTYCCIATKGIPAKGVLIAVGEAITDFPLPRNGKDIVVQHSN